MAISGVHLTDTLRYSTVVRRGSELFGVSAQTDSAIRYLHSLYILPYVIVAISGVHLTDTLRYSTVSQERV